MNGEIVRLGESVGIKTPAIKKLASMIHEAERENLEKGEYKTYAPTELLRIIYSVAPSVLQPSGTWIKILVKVIILICVVYCLRVFGRANDK